MSAKREAKAQGHASPALGGQSDILGDGPVGVLGLHPWVASSYRNLQSHNSGGQKVGWPLEDSEGDCSPWWQPTLSVLFGCNCVPLSLPLCHTAFLGVSESFPLIRNVGPVPSSG